MHDAAERISRNSRAQSRLISDLLDMNGIVSGKMRLNIEERVELARPLQAALDAVRLDAAKKEIHLAGPDPAPELQLDCDPDRLQQVFWNLLVNAIKFTPRGGSIGVAVDSAPATGWWSRSATPASASRPSSCRASSTASRQADSSSTRRHGGLGLGLSISRSLVEMHGGSIQVESEGLGRGTTFAVSLPLRQPGSAEGPASSWGELPEEVLPPAEQAPALRAAQVLVVDDDAESRDLVVHTLSQYGAAVASAGSAHEALQRIAERAPALLITDIGMPEIDGYELLRRVRQFSAVPAIAFTALVRPDDKAQAVARGFAALIAKPAEPAVIISVCSEVLAAAIALHGRH